MTHTDTMQDGRCDFDFFMGTWQMKHYRLRERLTGCTDWEEFEGVCVARPLPGVLGNIDESIMHRDSGVLHGMTLRLFNPASQQWSLYWGSSALGKLDVPMIGSFKDGIGEFYSQELWEGRAIFNRFVWSRISPTYCHWEQSFSPDGGKTWESNWIMEHTRQD
jgi:hypothetical protein